MNDDDNKHMAEVRITWEPERHTYWIDGLVMIPEIMFEKIFGFEPKEGDYEVEFTLNHEIKGDIFDDCGRVVD